MWRSGHGLARPTPPLSAAVPPNPRCSPVLTGWLSPDGDGDRPCQRRDHKAEVDPAPISLNGPGKHEKMEHDPQTHRDSQHEPNQIAGSLVDRPNGFALGGG